MVAAGSGHPRRPSNLSVIVFADRVHLRSERLVRKTDGRRWRVRQVRPKLKVMLTVLNSLIAVALVAVTLTLGVGIYSLFRGGDFGRTWSNKLMRLRVLLQFTAICIIVAAWWLGGHRH
jgi:hypothetical protein